MTVSTCTSTLITFIVILHFAVSRNDKNYLQIYVLLLLSKIFERYFQSKTVGEIYSFHIEYLSHALVISVVKFLMINSLVDKILVMHLIANPGSTF